MTTTFAALKAAGFRGIAKRIEDLDLPRIGHMIGVGEDEIHAVMDVEAAGSGFDGQGRPKILYEPHVFYRNSSGSARALAVAKGLAYAVWKPGSYPKDSYPRFLAALDIDETAAIKACSWGLSQILGENFVAAGYDTPQDMVVDFAADEDNHLEAMVRFIKANRLDDELRAHNWAGFARGYNGVRYRENRYDEKLAAAYAWWSKKPDTPWSPDMPEDPLPAPVTPVTPPPAPSPLPPRSGPVWEAYQRLATYFGDPPPKETAMVGGIIAGAAASKIGGVIADAVVDAVTRAARRDTNVLEPAAAKEVAVDAALEVKRDPRIRELEDHIEHVTNTESPLRSRVTQGATGGTVAGLVLLLVAVARMMGYDLSEDTETITAAVTGLIAFFGGLWALYGRWKARAPLFRR